MEALQEFLMQYRIAPKFTVSPAGDSEVVSKVEYHYTLGDPCYALYFGPRRDCDPRWVPAIVTEVHGTRSVNQLRPRTLPAGTDYASSSSSNQRNNPRLPTGDEYGRHNPRQSARTKRLPKKYYC